MKLFADYLLERENAHLLAYDFGFAVYKLLPDHCYLQDIFVVPSERQNGRGVQLEAEVIEVARKAGLKVIFGSVCPSTPFSTEMAKIMFKLNYKLSHCEADIIYYKKDI